ncbi:hypothetical protein [Lysobacter solisilvae (ex Woo and Kim 2020)]|uniref:Sodium:proline symporter n=1 Tax=Agrilutibacter terrestris TaxID=2865112 RepID=A0A7H0FWE9_9GAMM|nr:hypothetical protein [Lysobacter terrestris]QNP40365.1 hypothetical protein H8B22_12910 [Lysobacter terrestris]
MPAIVHHHPHLTVPGAHISGKALVFSALAAGAVFLVLELLVTRYVMGVDPGVMIRMIAAITQGTAMLPPPEAANLSVTLAAVVLHFAMSLAYAFVFAFFAKGRSLKAATLLGAGYGLLLYAVNFYGFTELFPWFAGARNWGAALAHVAFGAVLGAAYVHWAPRDAYHHG